MIRTQQAQGVRTVTPGIRAIQGQGQRVAGVNTMASTMLRPVTITTAGMRPLNPNAVAGGGTPIRLTSAALSQTSASRLISMPMIRTVAAGNSPGGQTAVRLARRPLNVGGAGGSPTGTALMMPILRQSVGQQGQQTSISLANVISVSSSSTQQGQITLTDLGASVGDVLSPIELPTLVQSAKSQTSSSKGE